MKSIFLKLTSTLALVGAALLTNLSATPVLIDTLDLSAFPPYGDGNVQTEINEAIAAWNLIHNPDLPTAGIGSVPDFKLDITDKDVLSIDLTLGAYNYLFLHWGGHDADSTYFNPQLYYIGGDSGLTTFDAPLDGDKRHGLSFYSFYSPKTSVPDSGITAILLGLGLVSLAFFRRKL